LKCSSNCENCKKKSRFSRKFHIFFLKNRKKFLNRNHFRFFFQIKLIIFWMLKPQKDLRLWKNLSLVTNNFLILSNYKILAKKNGEKSKFRQFFFWIKIYEQNRPKFGNVYILPVTYFLFEHFFFDLFGRNKFIFFATHVWNLKFPKFSNF